MSLASTWESISRETKSHLKSETKESAHLTTSVSAWKGMGCSLSLNQQIPHSLSNLLWPQQWQRNLDLPQHLHLFLSHASVENSNPRLMQKLEISQGGLALLCSTKRLKILAATPSKFSQSSQIWNGFFASKQHHRWWHQITKNPLFGQATNYSQNSEIKENWQTPKGIRNSKFPFSTPTSFGTTII